jgi:hypothetical protein
MYHMIDKSVGYYDPALEPCHVHTCVWGVGGSHMLWALVMTLCVFVAQAALEARGASLGPGS